MPLKRLILIFGDQEFNGAIPNTVIGRRKSKMAAVIPEVLICQLLDKIATPFQRLTPIFGVQELSGTIADSAWCNRKSVMQDGGRNTEC